MASLGTLTLDLVARTAGFVQGMSKAERASAKWRRQVRKDVQQVSKTLGTGLKVGAVAAAAGLSVVINRSRQAIDEQAKLAQRLNTTSQSLAVLKRATDRTGLSMKVIETAGRTLEINLGRATQGYKAQSEAVERLGLDVDQLSKLPLDERILKINAALRDNIPSYERAAVAADLFGSRGAAAIQQLDPGTIALAAEEARVFGLALSEVDAAKVENANDSFSRIGAAATGAGQQLTIAFAPVLQAVGDAFFETAKEAGGLGTATQNAVDRGVRAAAFLVNAADGVKRAFKIAANGIVASILGWKGVALEAALAVTKAYDSLPFTDAQAQVSDFSEAIRFNNEAIKIAGQELRALIETPLAGNQLVEAYEKAKVAAEQAAQAAVGARIARQGSDVNFPGAGGAAAGGAGGSLFIDVTDEFLQPQEDFKVNLKSREDAFKEHKERMVSIEQTTNGQLSNAARNLVGEQSGIYQALFAIEKGAAVARSIVAIQAAIAQASASGPFPANLGAMASVAAATAGLVSTISSTSIQGQAHDGLMSVPRTGTYILERGERVTTAETSAKMDGLIDEARMGGGGTVVAALGDAEIEKWLGGKSGEKIVLAHIRRNQSTVRSLARV